jgi:hypothetical protein
MSEDTPQIPDPQPIPEPTQVPVPKPVKIPRPKNRIQKSLLDTLPEPVKRDMERWMMEHSDLSTKEYMKNTYGKEFPKLLTSGKHIYVYYKTRHRERMNKELTLQKESATPPVEILSVIDSITNPDISLAEKRNALTALFNSCQARSKLLELRQTNFIDPSLEALLLANRKEQRAIIETVTKLSDSLSKENEHNYLGEFETFLSVILVAVYNTAKIVYGEANFSMFHSTLEETLQNSLKNYRAAKARLKESK